MKTGPELIHEIDQCKPEYGKMAFWWLGQMGFAIKLGETVIYMDPYLSEHPDRIIPPLLKPDEITNADFVFGSHDHSDHIDREAWRQLSQSSPQVRFVTPGILIHSLSQDLKIPENRFIGIDDGLTVSTRGLKISGIAAAHEFLDQDTNSGRYPYLGYILDGNGCILYHSGDTCIYEGMYSKLRKWNRIDAMFIPINGRDGKRYRTNCIGNMTYQEAVDLSGFVKPSLVIPSHYEMFRNNSENPLLFSDYLNAKYPEIKYWIGGHGEMTYCRTKNID